MTASTQQDFARSHRHDQARFTTLWRSFAYTVRRDPIGTVSAILLTAIVAAMLAAPVIATHDPNQVHASDALRGPNGTFLLGTDHFGRDVLSRILYGGRLSLRISFATVLVSAVSGATLGFIAGYIGGFCDRVLQTVFEAIMAIPVLFIAMALVASLGFSAWNVVIALSVAFMPTMFRIIRSSTYIVREEQYILAARSVGVSPMRMVLRHIVPQCVSPLIVVATSSLSVAILAEASLSFLGLGAPPPNASWGSMLGGATLQNYQAAPWLVIFPGITLSITVLAVSLLGDSLSDALDPRHRRR